MRVYVDLDNTLLDSASRLVDFESWYAPENQFTYELDRSLLKHFANPEFYNPSSIEANQNLQWYLDSLVREKDATLCFLSLSPTNEVAVAKRKLLDTLGYQDCDFLSFLNHEQEAQIMASLLRSAKESKEEVIFIDDNPYRILKFQDSKVAYKVLRHPYTQGRYPSSVYLGVANYYSLG